MPHEIELSIYLSIVILWVTCATPRPLTSPERECDAGHVRMNILTGLVPSIFAVTSMHCCAWLLAELNL